MKINKGQGYFLVVIVIYIKNGSGVPLKHNSGQFIAEKFFEIIRKYNRKPGPIEIDDISIFLEFFSDFLKLRDNIR